MRYKGRGLIHITGRDSYAGVGKILGVDLIKNPEYASSLPEAAVAVSVVFWQWKNQQAPLMKAADRKDIVAISTYIAGDPPNGLANREQFYRNALKVFHVQ